MMTNMKIRFNSDDDLPLKNTRTAQHNNIC